MRFTFASHTAQVGVFRVGSHHLTRELARQGHEVTHISTPSSLLHLSRIRDANVRARLKLALASPRLDHEGVRHVEPLVLLPLGNVSSRLRDLEIRHPVKPWRLGLGHRPASPRPDVLFIDQPLLGPELIRLLQPRTVIYRPTDAHFDPVMRAAELEVLGRADAVVATSQHVLEEVTSGVNRSLPSLVLENGVEYDRFHGVAAGDGRREGVVYLGALDKRFDWSVTAALATAYPNVPFLIAGPVPARTPAALPANVRLLGSVPYADAPALLAGARIGLLPLSSDPGNAGRSPMKYFEYLAAGLSIVASSSEALRARSAPHVWLYDGESSAIEALGEALAESSDDSNTEGAAYAAAFGWSKRAETLAEFVRSL